MFCVKFAPHGVCVGHTMYADLYSFFLLCLSKTCNQSVPTHHLLHHCLPKIHVAIMSISSTITFNSLL